MNIETYHSENAPEHRRWIAFVVTTNVHLPVRFQGRTEDEARAQAQAEWDRHEVKREANRARREESRRKAAEARARKDGKAA